MTLGRFTIHLTAALAFLGVPALPQTPATPESTTQAHTNDIGYSYRLPADWEFVEQQPKPAPPAQPQSSSKLLKLQELPDSRNGASCAQVALTARHGHPSSAIVAVMLPFDCYGQTMADTDLPGFGDGAAEGLKQTFDIAASTTSTYILDGHTIWIERATGMAKGQQNAPVSTLEIACAILKKGAVCWMVVAIDDAALKTFESAPVTLDDGAANPLVPPEAAAKLVNAAAQKPITQGR